MHTRRHFDGGLRLEEAYHRCAGELNVQDSDTAAKEFGASVGSWPAFPDSAESLTRLQKMGLKLVILSNVNVASFNEWAISFRPCCPCLVLIPL